MKMTTYEMLKRVFAARKDEGDDEWKEEWVFKLDVYLANGRITVNEYDELVKILNTVAMQQE